MTNPTPQGDLSDAKQQSEPQTELAADQTDEQRELTDLIGLVQSRAEAEGWQVEVVATDTPGTILGLTSPSGRDFSLMANPTH